jgi:hypothetical protein
MENIMHYASWKSLPWTIFQVRLRTLQEKIYNAKQQGDIKKVYFYQSLLIRDPATHCIAIRYIIDTLQYKLVNLIKSKSWDDEEKLQFASRLEYTVDNWNYTNDSYFNVEDTIVTYILQLALDPAHNLVSSWSDYDSYKKRHIWYIQKKIYAEFKRSKFNIEKKAFSINVTSILVTANHNILIKRLCLPNIYKLNVFRALKSGLFRTLTSYNLDNYSDLPVLVSSLVNILLNETEKINLILESSRSQPLFRTKTKPIFGIRYKSCLLYLIDKNHNTVRILTHLDRLLYSNGLELTKSNIGIAHVSQGFEFLGWRFIVKKTGRITCYPTKSNLDIYKSKVKGILKNSRYRIEFRLEKLKSIVKDWHTYHQFCEMSQVNAQVYYLRVWCNNYIRKASSIPKDKRLLYIKQIFNNHKSKLNGYNELI